MYGKMNWRLLTSLGLTLPDHEGADLRVWQLQQLLSFVSAQPFKQPAREKKDSHEYPEYTLPQERQEGCRNDPGPANIKPSAGIKKKKKSKAINGSFIHLIFQIKFPSTHCKPGVTLDN